MSLVKTERERERERNVNGEEGSAQRIKFIGVVDAVVIVILFSVAFFDQCALFEFMSLISGPSVLL